MTDFVINYIYLDNCLVLEKSCMMATAKVGEFQLSSLNSNLEFDVQMTCQACSNAVKSSLENLDGVQNVSIDLEKQQVLVETSLPSSVIQEKIESTNRKAILKGIGTISNGSSSIAQAAVAALTGPTNVMGIVRFLQEQDSNCIIDGTVDGLEPGEHGLHVYEYGDLSNGCAKLGQHYNPTNSSHGGPLDTEKHVGDLGNIIADATGRATFRMENDALQVWNIIGRSLALTANRDDCGKGNNEMSKINGNCGKGIACGIIARSAGLFENPKRLCQCSGRTVWEERDDTIQSNRQSKM